MEKGISVIILSLVVFTPLAFSSVDPWAYLIVEGAAFLALLLSLFYQLKKKTALQQVPGLLPLTLFLGWLLLQLIPLPISMVSQISPKAAAISSLGVWGGESRQYVPLSLAPRETLFTFFRYAAYAVVYIVTIQHLRGRKSINRLVSVLVTTACLVSFIGFVQYYAGATSLLGIRKFTVDSFFGIFIYRNHFGAMVAMMIPLCLSMVMFAGQRSLPRSIPWRRRLSITLADAVSSRQLYFFLALILLVLALGLCKARGPLIAALLTGVPLLLILGRRHKKNSAALLVAGALAVAVFTPGVGSDVLQSLDARFGQAIVRDWQTVTGRTTIWKNSVDLVRDYPLSGSGAGSFYSVYPGYLVKESHTLPQHAHNDYLELLTDTGVIGLALVGWFIFSVFKATLRVFRKRRDTYVVHLYSGLLAGLAAVLLHCTMELNFHINAAIGLLFFVFLALLVNVVQLSSRKKAPVYLPATKKSPVKIWGGAGLAFACMVSMLLFIGGEFYAGILVPENRRLEAAQAKVGFEQKKRLRAKAELKLPVNAGAEQIAAIRARLDRAARSAFLNPLYPYLLAQLEKVDGNNLAALKNLKPVIWLRPAESCYYHYASQIFSLLGKGQRAEQALALAIFLNPKEFTYRKEHIDMLLAGQREARLEDEVAAIVAAFPQRASQIFNHLASRDVDLFDTAGKMPPSLSTLAAIAKVFEKRRDMEGAGEIYAQMSVLYEAPGHQEKRHLKREYFQQPYRFYAKTNQPEKALGIMRMAVRHLPADHTFRVQCGNLYKRMGLNQYAREQYRQALVLQPNDLQTQAKLELLIN